MRKLRFVLPATIILIVVALVAARVAAMLNFASGDTVTIAVVFNTGEDHQRPYILRAYERALREEGIPATPMAETGPLILLPGAELARRFPAMILADGINRQANPTLIRRLNEYVAAGGSLAIVNDPASQDRMGHYLARGRLIDLAGVDYVRYGALGTQSYTTGELTFRDRTTALQWNVPPGKLIGTTIAAASYGRLKYPIPASRVIAPGVEVIASDHSIPMITVRHIGRSTIMFVGVPAGYLEAYGDALPMRLMLRTLLRTYVPIPHLAAAPGATGTIVVGWQIDSALQQKEIPEAIRLGYFRRGERFEFDVSAGRDRSRPGDGLGFDACGSGAAALRALEPYGNIGSHGSMDDLLAAGLQKQTPSDESMRDEVSKNDTCLAREAGYTIRSFASPAGETPPALIHAIDSIGLTGYSYSGDAGAAPTRAWVDAQSPAEGAWAFPIMPSGDARSLADMQRSGFEQSQVAQWLDDTTAYAERERTIVSISSNLDDLLRTGYGSTWAAFLDRLEPQLRAGEVQMLDVPQAAAFLDKFVATAFAFRRLSGSLAVELRNPEGLGGIGFAVPQAWLGSAPTPAELSDRGITDGFHYFTVATQATDLTVRFASVR